MTTEFYKFLGEALNISDFLNDLVEKEGYNNRAGLLKIMLFQNALVQFTTSVDDQGEPEWRDFLRAQEKELRNANDDSNL